MGERSIKEFLFLLRKKLWLIIILTVVPIIISGVLGAYKSEAEPVYRATTTLIVGGPKSYVNNENELDYEMYKAINGKFMSHFKEIVKMEIVGEEVIENLNLDITYGQLAQKLDLDVIEDTDMIKIIIEDKDRELASKIVNEYVDVSLKKAKESIGIENVQAIDEVQIRPVPLKSKTKTNMGISGVLGFAVSILIILIIEFTDTTIKNPRTIEKHFNLPVTGIIQKTEEDLVLASKPDSFVSENYRALMANIRSIQEEKKIKSILITPFTAEKDGSLVSSNIAIAMAEIGKKVLLIDGDLRKPKVHTYFNIDNELGLSNILDGDIDLNKAINKVDVGEKLEVLTSGAIGSNPVKLLASGKMKNLLDKVEEDYDIIIVNAPSLGVIADPTILSTYVDGIIPICTAKKTKIDEIKKGEKLITKVNGKILGVILDEVNLKDDLYYDYFYESYKYYG